jgi:hypothetical protein
MILSGQFSCAQTAHFGIFGKDKISAPQNEWAINPPLPGQRQPAPAKHIGGPMEKSHFALSLGLVGVIFVMQAARFGLWHMPPPGLCRR